MTGWLDIVRGNAPLIVSIPHAGTMIPDALAARLVSPALARHDADFHIPELYGFAAGLGATVISTAVSRTVIDVNRDPSGASLYPGQATTGLCPVTSFAGEPFYRAGDEPDEREIAARRERWFRPYHAAITAEIARLRATHERVVLYDAHSILGRVPRLFEGELPQFCIGTNDGASGDRALANMVGAVCAASGHSHVTNGRFKGGWITRHYGDPQGGVHAIQMELAMRGYLDEAGVWPPVWEAARAAPLQHILKQVLAACLTFAKGTS